MNIKYIETKLQYINDLKNLSNIDKNNWYVLQWNYNKITGKYFEPKS